MIISKTPVRISFFGGGSDYPAWLEDNDGAVLSTSIDKYVYISCRPFPPFFDFSININYSKIEHCNAVDEIVHPAVRECLRYMGIAGGIEVNHSSDLPGRSGLGSSSAFTVGLLNALHVFRGLELEARELARIASHVEQDWIKENVGFQDQYAVAMGGFNCITFKKSGEIFVSPVRAKAERIRELERHLLLFHSRTTRTATEVVQEQLSELRNNVETVAKMRELVGAGLAVVEGEGDLLEFGKLLHESWMLKRTLSKKISNEGIDGIYRKAIEAGALGGKLLGAGAAGCLLFFVEPSDQEAVKATLGDLIHIPFKFETEGSRVIYRSE